MIIGISGKIGSGKDTVGKIIQYFTTRPDMSYSSFLLLDKQTQEYNWKIKKFAGKLKEIVSILTGCKIEDLESQEFKDSELPIEWTNQKLHDTGVEPIIEEWLWTYRELLQILGTEAMRNVIHPNIWVNALFVDYTIKGGFGYTNDAQTECSIIKKGQYPNWIITDVRFPNELKAIKDKGGINIRVNRYTGHVGIDNDTHVVTDWQHSSETALDNVKSDYIINNDKDINHLIAQVKAILIKEKII